MVKLAIKAVGLGVLGAIILPVVTFFGTLAVSYAFDSRCGTPGDSGGCEMGAGVMGFVSVIPGFLLGIATAIFRHWRRTSNAVHTPDATNLDPPAPGDLGGIRAARLDDVRAWAESATEIHRVWLTGARARGDHRVPAPVQLALHLFYWDSPDPRDRTQAFGSWFYHNKRWRDELAAILALPIKLRWFSQDGEDRNTMRAVPSESALIYERSS